MGWQSTSTTPGATNIDFFVTDPNGQTASAANPVVGTGTESGMHSGDALGLAGGGTEQVQWILFFPSGGYTVTARHQGGDDAQITIEATQGNETARVGSFGIDPDPPIILKSGESFSGTINATETKPQAARVRAANRRERSRALARPHVNR